MTPLLTPRLVIRNWEECDRDLFFLINSDDRVMEFFPFRRDRATPLATSTIPACRTRTQTSAVMCSTG